jgi:hypothetical protein
MTRLITLAEGVGFEPTDSLLSSAFKALALGRYANPPGRPARGRRSGANSRSMPSWLLAGVCQLQHAAIHPGSGDEYGTT